MRQALQIIAHFNMERADQQLIRMLDNDQLDRTVRKNIYDTLARLSTKNAVDQLAELAQDDKLAAKALEDVNPGAAADFLLEHLVTGEGYVRLDIYRALTRICRIEKPKVDVWWERVDETLKRNEIERVKTQVQECGKRWKTLNA
jgi:hypothetical protein